uniref:Integrase catalytic domain-containing protein n=1 Tax=Triticum urartu TaxID=4572 RepID=A0A8R7RD00_TRIUA
MNANPGTLHSLSPHSSPNQIVVGNSGRLPITHTGHGSLITTNSSLVLRNVLLSPSLITNLLSVRQLTRENPISVEFDAFGFSVKDIHTRQVIRRCDSTGDLYPVMPCGAPSSSPPFAGVASVELWHQRLGHPGDDALRRVLHQFRFTCAPSAPHTCHACRLGKHARLPFSSSHTPSYFPFQLLHLDVWTSPVASVSSFMYYLVVLDSCMHYVWTFPLRHKSNVLSVLTAFYAYVQTQFERPVLAFQTDNGKEFDSLAVRSLLSKHGTVLRLSCPYTSQQNGKAERMLRTLNNSVRSLLFHAFMPARFWAEALGTATLLLNYKPCTTSSPRSPHELLLGTAPDYSTLRMFGCLCYPNTSSTSRHKLDHRSVACVFFGYPPDHRGYRCYDPRTRQVLTSRHVRFHETHFPFAVAPDLPAVGATQAPRYVPAPLQVPLTAPPPPCDASSPDSVEFGPHASHQRAGAAGSSSAA